MNALAKYLNTTSNDVSATICSGTYALPATAAVYNSSITSLTLSCCGNANSCIIDGGAAGSLPVIRTKTLFTFQQPITLDIQGIMFQNFDCLDCEGSLLTTEDSALTFKHNTVRKMKSLFVSSHCIIFVFKGMRKVTLPAPLYAFWPTFQYGALNIYRGKLVVIENCTFSDNLGWPAGAYISSVAVLMNGNSFLRNRGRAGVCMEISDSLAVANCNKFEENEAFDEFGNFVYGAVFYLYRSTVDAKLNIFMKNKVNGYGNGGAIKSDYSQLYLTSNTFTSNTAPDYGGAIEVTDSAIISNADSFTNNTAYVSLFHMFLFQIISLYQSLTDVVPCFPF